MKAPRLMSIFIVPSTKLPNFLSRDNQLIYILGIVTKSSGPFFFCVFHCQIQRVEMRLIKLWDYQRILMGLHLTPQKMPPIIWVKKKTKFYLFYFFILFFWNWSILSLAKIGKMANIIVKGFHYTSDVTLNLFPNCLEFCTFYIHYTILYYTIHVVCVSLPILPQHNLDFPFQDKGNKKKINM